MPSMCAWLCDLSPHYLSLAAAKNSPTKSPITFPNPPVPPAAPSPTQALDEADNTGLAPAHGLSVHSGEGSNGVHGYS